MKDRSAITGGFASFIPVPSRMLLPYLTENSGARYADQTAAEADFTDKCFTCRIYSQLSKTLYTTLTMSRAGAVVSVAETSGIDGPENAGSAQSVILSDAAAISAAYVYNSSGDSTNLRTGNVRMTIYDAAGIFVYDEIDNINADNATGTLTSTTLPAGRYILELNITSHHTTVAVGESTNADFTLSVNTGTISAALPIRALFDPAPGYVDCS